MKPVYKLAVPWVESQEQREIRESQAAFFEAVAPTLNAALDEQVLGHHPRHDNPEDPT